MKVVLLAGGWGTRISEESERRPKPMIEIGGMPILWHIMKEYSHYGFNEFIVCAGYKHHVIKKWFADYAFYTSDMTFDFSNDSIEIIDKKPEPWKVSVINTGLYTSTGGRIKRIQNLVGNDRFMMTYGDGVCDVNISDLLDYHIKSGKTATLTAVEVNEMKGIVDIAFDNSVTSFREKHHSDTSLVNAGYMVFEPEIFDYLQDDSVLETEVLTELAEKGELMSYNHRGFWQCMDTMFEKGKLESMIEAGKAPWIKW